ncbi:4Fe-4S dicluster domain-containing protein [Taibaiella lutea]|uniref:4Fe-4S dicluster domain-containing protein n=1 Tax=Taibaiella lutea TaxID=2608001 RepID=A0A5M6CHE8_9BACT|nr:TAT-variant-translocated molybdopterin oxidoreductase [Taibaiella lutea]KAA5533352.1 4Fe-4S dicluster domain-containing protein [Taibaiella lutea]
MSHKKYWKGIEELEQTPEHQQAVANEFQQDLPVLGLSDKLLDATTPRRDFLKFLGFSTVAATLAASCEMPVRKAIPYAIRPDAELLTPSVPNYYASTFSDNGDSCAVIVKTRDGRPIMIEPNTLSTVTQGGISARVIAATLSLYDTARLRGPYVNQQPVSTWDKVDAPITQALANAGGAVYLVTGTINSPTTKEIINRFLAKYPGSKHIQYDAVSYSGMLLANEMSYGKRALPTYHFDKVQTVFSIGADFLCTWLAPVEFSAGFSKTRKILGKDAKNATMSKHYQVEGMMTLSGANADERATCKPSEYGKVASALYAAITGGSVNTGSKNVDKLIVAAAADLKKGNGLVVCNSNDVNVQVVVNAINSAIGANGTTIDWSATSNYKQGIDSEMVTFVNALDAGQVGAVLIHGVNPVYDYFDGEKFKKALAKAKVSISFNDRLDETTQACNYAVPDNHWLESWGDAEPRTGYYSFMQPTIAPLFKTRAFQDSLLKWTGADLATDNYHNFYNQYWVAKLGGQSNFDKALQDGVAEPASPTMSGASFSGNVADAMTKASAVKGGAYEVVVYETMAIGSGGAWSNNPWLQETPDPITKATWDNYVMMAPLTAKTQFDAELSGINEVVRERRVVKVTANGKTVSLPIVVVPGMHKDVIAVAVGYGRHEKVGRASTNGQNAFPLVGFNGQTFGYASEAKIEKTADLYPVAITQTHLSSENRPHVREYTLEEFKKDPRGLINERKEELKHFTHLEWEGHEADDPNADFDEEGFVKNGTMYPVHEKPGIKWGMSIDLNTCTGCAACVVACQAENNVSVVGKHEVMKSQEMSWIRIDRYFSGNPDDGDSIQAIFQPVMCQHCDNAPCENVCPVSATNHSSEGLNQMAYNRCIGTKYCANNCPYKVRRFNWFDFNGADAFADNQYEDGQRDDINDSLTRMVLNPDVTVRSRGVMEKCSFCVQRLQDAKLVAKKEGHPLKDGQAKTACQVACASNCITFGNVNDKESEIYKVRYEDNKERVFYMLEQLHILPNVNYLSKIRNAKEVLAGNGDKNNTRDEMANQHI